MLKLNLDQFKAFIFDMDGTMVNNSKYHEASWFEFVEKYGFNLTKKEFKKKIFGKRNREAFEAFFGRKLTQKEADEYGWFKEKAYRDLYAPVIKEVKGLSKLIKKIKEKGLKIAIATTAPKINRKFVLDSLNLHGNFEVIIGEEHINKGKPDPEIYLKAAKALKVEAKSCLVFEDSPVGVRAAKAAGMRVVGVLTSHKKDELKEADWSVPHFEEVELS